jgi:ADP-heptose:LPS heptosyltransferase
MSISAAHGAGYRQAIRAGPVPTGADLLNWGPKRPQVRCGSIVNNLGPKTIIKLDRYAGIPGCFLLTGFDRLKKLFTAKTSYAEAPRKILFLKLTEQGASILAHSAIKRAEALVGRENVFFCVFAENRPILDIMGSIRPDNIFEIRQDNLFSFCGDILRFLFKTRKRKIDTVIDMEFFSRASAMISYLSGASIRVGCHRYSADLPYRGNLMTHRIQYNPYIHVVHQYDLLVQAAMRPLAECPMIKAEYDEALPAPAHVKPQEHVFEEVRSVLRRLGVSEGCPVVLLNPNASDMLPIRKWETERFVELAHRLIDTNKRLFVLFTGAPSEQGICEEIATRVNSSRAVCVAGHTTLEELIAIYWISDVLVTNDSGPGHFASLTDIKTVVMFGPETPRLFGPLGDKASIIWKRLACSPCVSAFNHRNTPCNHNVCMKMITVDEVFEKVTAILGDCNGRR